MSVPVVTICVCCGDEMIVEDRTVFDSELGGHVCDECKWHLRNAVAQMKLQNIRGCLRFKNDRGDQKAA